MIKYKTILLALLLTGSFATNNLVAQNNISLLSTKEVDKTSIKQSKFILSRNKTILSGCGVDTSQNGILPFRDQQGTIFNSYLCALHDSVSGTSANGAAFKDGDGFRIKLIQGSQVTFSVGVDSCVTHPVSLTVCDSSNNPISGAYAASGCPSSLNFTAPYSGLFIVVMNENGICFGAGQIGIGDIFCYKEIGTTLPPCLLGPSNDSICGAFPLSIGGTFYNGDNSFADLNDVKDSNVVASGFGCSIPNNTLWYSFTASLTENISIVCYSPMSSGLDAWIGVFDAASCTDSLLNGSCYGGPNGIGDTVRIMIPVIAGTTYYFMIDGDNNSVGEFKIGIENSPTYPINDTICGASNLVLDSAFISGNTADAQGSDPSDNDVANAGYNCGIPNNTEWFVFSPMVSDSFDLVMTTNGFSFSSWIGEFRTSTNVVDCHWPLIFEQCLSGTNNSFSDTAINRIYLSNNYNYFFMIDGFSNSKGDFSLGIKSVTHVGVNEFESNIRALSIYPNPANEEININYNFFNAENIDFQLIDLTGRVLINDSGSGIKNGTKTISVKNINNGIYVLRISGAFGNFSRKIMVQR